MHKIGEKIMIFWSMLKMNESMARMKERTHIKTWQPYEWRWANVYGVGKIWNLILYFLCAHTECHESNGEFREAYIATANQYQSTICIFLSVHLYYLRAITRWVILRRRFSFPLVLSWIFALASILLGLFHEHSNA